MRFLKWLAGGLTDPIQGTLSSTRLAGLLCTVTGCAIAWHKPDGSAPTISALIVGGAVAFLTRTKSDAP